MKNAGETDMLQQMCVRHFTVRRRDLVYLKFIMEAHEGLATLSTVDKLNGIVRISYHEFFRCDVEELLRELQEELGMETVYFQ